MLQIIVDWFVYSLLRMDSSSRFAAMANFFIYDSVKIITLLYVMILFIGFLRTFLSRAKVKKWLSGKEGMSHLSASLFGAVTPFCSCSSIPIFLSFTQAGVPLGINFSFLITSPLINEYLVVLMLGYFGFKITVAYIVSGILIGTVCGLILGRMKLERYLVKDFDVSASSQETEEIFRSVKERIVFGLNEARSIVKKIWLWILFGISLGALIHNYIPQQAIEAAISKAGIFSVPIAAILGVPMYGSCAAIVPIAVVLFQKGVPLGTALAFMMATAALSLPEAVMLRRAMHLKLIAIFFGVTTLSIILTGYLFNFLQLLLI